MSDFNPSVTLYNNVNAGSPPRGDISIEKALAMIQRGDVASEVAAIRAVQHEDPKQLKKLRTPLKKRLPAVTWSGTFKPFYVPDPKAGIEVPSYRCAEGLAEYSHIICHDIDGLAPAELQRVHNTVVAEVGQKDRLLRACFVSPTGNGLKLLFLTNTGPADHLRAWTALGAYVEEIAGVPVDVTTKDVCRLCFLSHDPELYHDPEADSINEEFIQLWTPKKPVPTAAPKTSAKQATANAIVAASNAADYIVKSHETVQKTVNAGPGTHNRYANLYALQANRHGISEHDTISELHSYMPDYNGKELEATVKNVYKNKSDEHGKYRQNSHNNGQRPAQPKAAVPPGTAPATTAAGDYDKEVPFWYACKTRVEPGEGDEPERITKEYRISYDDLATFLQRNGFYKYRVGDGYELVLVKPGGQIVEVVSRLRIKEFLLDFLKSESTQEFKQVRELFRRGSNKYCNVETVEGLTYHTFPFKRDTRDTANVYFANCYLQITAGGVERRQYDSLRDECLWKKQVIPRDYAEVDWNAGDFPRYISNAILGRKCEPADHTDADKEMLASVYTTIGYLLHRYKNPALAKAVIATDRVLRKGKKNEGGTGKSLLYKGLREMLIGTLIDGKNFTFERPFLWQQVSVYTELINLDDVQEKFDFTRLFSLITEEFTLEKKFEGTVTLPFETSPKFYISTNQTLRGDGASSHRRQQIVEFSDYYKLGFQPQHEFNRLFFQDWPLDEWQRFYAFMVYCLQCYLRDGLKPFPLENYGMNKLLDKGYGEEFVDYMNETVRDELHCNTELQLKELYANCVKDIPEKYRYTQKEFTARLHAWCEVENLVINPHKIGTKDYPRDRRNGIDYIRFARPVQEASTDAEPTKTVLPF